MALSEWETYRPVYEALRSLSSSMLAQVSGDGAAPTGVADLRSLFDRLQTQFQQQVLTLDLSRLEGAIAAQVTSLHTEMAKQLRLLNMDLMFLQTARRPETARQRAEQMGDRLRLLMRYCDAVLGEEA
ncbi:heterocyst frequency control protein PatD [Thermoleptolyngbya sp. C42_A2020_037]|uniref:heterocyst frequency control protein PatD n=1 Tax=Thermoleptolyngbya sp. C42_A2020_037 TaxID=2747799 RepID=UPI0019FA5A4C|nr:heterocyst frequency control protein PatD [Thermoleptolyngbya sp. C42_A2020_037]MBF2086323.1 heterocyst frequency control protein PatD [Thermoleptolyngbya sp. C42_A2020_037]